jgi:NAD(P)-dependent dehydrogenase (short-subunit alcohol dehydrogenase family)
MRPRRKVRNQVIVVVGATTGVGRATVSAALDQGARVAAVSADADALAALVEEEGRPHRLEAIPGVGGLSARHVVHSTTARFGLLHTWVHVVGRSGVDAVDLAEAGIVAVPQLRRSGGGTFVAVVAEPDGRVAFDPAARRAARSVAQVRAVLTGRHDLAAVVRVVRSGVTAPREVSDAVLRVAVRPRAEVTVHGPPRWLSLVTPVRSGTDVVARSRVAPPNRGMRRTASPLSLSK